MRQGSIMRRHPVCVLISVVLTFFCWCPLGYGRYGEVARVLGVPYWVVLAFLFGVALFVLEWVYLFRSGEAMDDEDLPKVFSELAALDAATPAPAEEED